MLVLVVCKEEIFRLYCVGIYGVVNGGPLFGEGKHSFMMMDLFIFPEVEGAGSLFHVEGCWQVVWSLWKCTLCWNMLWFWVAVEFRRGGIK